MALLIVDIYFSSIIGLLEQHWLFDTEESQKMALAMRTKCN